jgi:hypothetical protein
MVVMKFQLLYVLMLLMFNHGSALAEDPVYIPDPLLKATIEDTLGVADPSPSDMYNLIRLACVGNEWVETEMISDITGLEQAINLQDLNLRLNDISDISPLAHCLHLQSLNISQNQISDLAPLSHLIQLDDLNIHANNIDDISPLADLTLLEHLDLHKNDLTELPDLSAMTNLTTLRLSGNRLTDLSPLANLVNLESLWLFKNRIYDLSPLADLAKLEDLVLGFNRVSDLSPLIHLSKLGDLDVSYNRLTDTSPLTNLTSLYYLDLSGNYDLPNVTFSRHLQEIYDNNPGISLYHSSNPNPPSGLHTSSSTNKAKVTVCWLPVENGPNMTTHYRVYRALSVSEEKMPISDWHTSLCVNDPHVEPGLSYYYWIQAALNESGDENGPFSQAVLGQYSEPIGVIHVVSTYGITPSVRDTIMNGTREAPYNLIQTAINAAAVNATILVSSGVYPENIDFHGKRIHLSGIQPDNTGFPIIEGTGAGPLVSFTNHEDPNCVLQGFVLTRKGVGTTPALYCHTASPTVTNCLIVGNITQGIDGSDSTIACDHSSIRFINCTIADNIAHPDSACVHLINSPAMFVNSIIWNNTPNTFSVVGNSDPAFSHNNMSSPLPSAINNLHDHAGNLSQDPLFIQAGHWSDIDTAQPTWVPGDYHLMSESGHWDQQTVQWVNDDYTSPSINTGSPDDALRSEPQPHGGIINMGAYGGSSEASLSVPSSIH